MPCHFYTSVSNFRMFGHMLCYLISAIVTNNVGVGFYFQEFAGECNSVKSKFDTYYSYVFLSAFSFGLGCRSFRLQLSCPRSADTAM